MSGYVEDTTDGPLSNYVIWTNCQINETQRKFNIEPCADPETRQAYHKMWEISRDSARKFLHGDWKEITFTDPAETRVEMFQQNWQRIWDIWHKESCNILYLDSDTLFVKPTRIFGEFQEFRLFNWTDPKSNHIYPNYYNAGVRYYPAEMRSAIWDLGDSMSKHWNLDIWDQEQLIFNEMFWQQNITDPHHPEFNWQGQYLAQRPGDRQLLEYHEEWNQLPVKDAHIMHVHGSRGAKITARVMEQIAKDVGIY